MKTRWRLDAGQIEVVEDDVAAMLRSKTPAERVAMIGAAHRTAKLMLAAAIRRRHPEWDDAMVAKEVARAFYMEQLDLLRYAVGVLEGAGIPYMVVGSFASGAYGNPRFTNDIDIVVELSAAQLDSLLNGFPRSDFYVSREAATSAIGTGGQFNVIHPESGVKIDFMVARQDPYGIEQLQRRRKLDLVVGLQASTASPEDVIIAKMLFYQEGGSEKHMRDIASMFKVSGNQIDREYIDKWASSLGVEDVWEAILNRVRS